MNGLLTQFDNDNASGSLQPVIEFSPGLEVVTLKRFLNGLRNDIDFAFQPIVDCQTGRCYGVEALLRGHEKLGFGAISNIFDYACEQRILHQVELVLRDMIFEKYKAGGFGEDVKLFLNLDNRTIDSPDYNIGATGGILERHGLPPHMICFEISERHEVNESSTASRVLENYRRQSYRLAVDDFGTGFSGMKLLYERNPDYIKIDRFFITGIAQNNKKKLFLSYIIDLAHVLGILVVAEGVETESEFLTCKEIGCDLAQGFLIQKPTTDCSSIFAHNAVVADINRKYHRSHASDAQFISDQIEHPPTISIETPLNAVFDQFCQYRHLTFFPVVDDGNQPMGLILETDIKHLSYSLYGKDLMANRTFKKHVKDFLVPCPIADLTTKAEKVLETFTLSGNAQGVIISDNHRYSGFLSAQSLLRVINEKNLSQARDQNPLTKLPGNDSIANYLFSILETGGGGGVLVYFDFDNFKPFNDTYGFRQGDRIIILFSDLMRKCLVGESVFRGHVGGDDFFAGFKNLKRQDVLKIVNALIADFSHDVESFYDDESRKKKCIYASNRRGERQRYGLLTVSAAVLELPPDTPPTALEAISEKIAELKRAAKAQRGHVAFAHFDAKGPS